MSRVFLSGSIRGGRRLVDTYRFMADVMIGAGIDVLSEHVARENVFAQERNMTEEEIFLRDMAGIQQCDCLVAEVSVPSVGVGYEICQAVGLKKPVLCVYERGSKVSAMVLGNKGVHVQSYGGIDELHDVVLEFVVSV
ncbi:MAG: nucleoside 2-deoxyribosyltransferase [ANME-2 cluster archaeon]|nr:nucleoside 2-deoxyribosyltransferase [ANME-2 cluster archaeon]MDF1557815.1 nucleoside 2-deoxyribosyltransferase [ANME-2 cluster archaeon]